MPSSKVFTGTGRSQENFERIVTSRIIAIVRLSDEASLVQVAEALARGGVECLEFTSGTPGFLDAIAESRRVIGERALIGAGTVVSEDQARECVAAGAQFVVSPGLFRPVVDAALDLDVVSIPGAMTPTEIIQAWEWGAHAVKVFPVRQLGTPIHPGCPRPGTAHSTRGGGWRRCVKRSGVPPSRRHRRRRGWPAR